MTDRRYEGATAEQLAHPFVQELLAIHDLFRNQMAAMLDYVDDVLQGSAQLSEPETKLRIRPLIQAGTQYTYLLHSHHHIETASLFPVLQQEGLEAAVVDRLNAEHDELGVMIDKFSADFTDFAD